MSTEPITNAAAIRELDIEELYEIQGGGSGPSWDTLWIGGDEDGLARS